MNASNPLTRRVMGTDAALDARHKNLDLDGQEPVRGGLAEF